MFRSLIANLLCFLNGSMIVLPNRAERSQLRLVMLRCIAANRTRESAAACRVVIGGLDVAAVRAT